MPFDSTPENIPTFRSSTFNNSGVFPQMNTEPARIHLMPDATPYVRHSIPVPHHWKDTNKQSLSRDVARGIITLVFIDTPVTWCAPMVVTPKKDGSPRRTVDQQRLNSVSIRETHCMKTHSISQHSSQNSAGIDIAIATGIQGIWWRIHTPL